MKQLHCYNNAIVCSQRSEGKTSGGNAIEPIISVSGLYLSYPDRADVLNDINLIVMPGEKVGLIGPNGAGKTTLFMGICGLLKPSSGQIIISGKPVVNGEFRSEIGLVFQNPDDQLFCPSVRDDVAFGPQNMGLAKGEVEARVIESLSKVKELDLADRPPHHLSEGEKRMVSIAAVMAMRPQLIIYDEPSANLDLRSRRHLIRLLQKSTETVLIASHDLELILEICSRVVIIDKGQIVAEGETLDIMSNDKLLQAHGQEIPHSLIPHQVMHPH